MPTVMERVLALATRAGEEIKSVRSVMALDSAVLHKSGDETLSGIKTFGSAPVVPSPSAAGNPVRHDDTRNSNARPPTAHSHAVGDLPVGTTGSTVAAGNDARLSDSRAATGVVDVTKYGATGNGTTDDTAAIAAAIAACPAGGMVWFPPGTYLISACLRFVGRRVYRGVGGRAQCSILKAAASVSGGALAAADGWYSSAAVCDSPIMVDGLQFDTSSVANLHGLVVYNFWSTFRDLQFVNLSGTSAHGLHVTDKGRNGSTVTSNSHSENVYENLRFYDHRSGAEAFYAESNNGISNQDGHLRNSFFAGIGGHAIHIGRIAGWSVVDNHLYGIGKNGIYGENGGYATKIQDNYIEDFGNENSASGYYNGIALTMLDTRGSKVSGNTVSLRPPHDLITDALLTPAAQRWTAIYVQAGWGQQSVRVAVTDNVITWADVAPASNFYTRCWAMDLDCNGSGGQSPGPAKLQVEYAGNLIDPTPGWVKRWNVHANSTVTLDYRKGAQAVAGGLALALNCETMYSTVTWTPTTGTAAISVGLPTGADQDGDTFSLTVVAGVTARTLTFNASYGLLAGITAVQSIPANKKLRALLRYSTADASWTVEAAAVQQ